MLGPGKREGAAGLNSAVTRMENPDMWDYWKEKRGSPSEALEADYPNLLKSNTQLQMAIAAIKHNQAMIDNIMQEISTCDGLSGILGTAFGNCGE